MTINGLDQHIEITPGVAGGKPRIRGRRIAVQDVVIWHERLGLHADVIATEYDLALADVYAALAYYFDHREEMDKAMTEDQVFVEVIQQRTASKVQQRFQGGSSRGEPFPPHR